MLRVVVLASIASACAACKPAPPATTIGHVGSTTVEPERAAPPPPAGGPAAALAVVLHAQATIEHTLAAPGGSAYLYTYRRLEAELGQRAAAGHDVKSELETEQHRCEADRAVLAPEERERLDVEYQTCEALAGALLLADDQLTRECKALGVAYFDASGTLLGAFDVGGPCVAHIGSFEAFDVTPADDDELMVLATFETHGELTGGGWGRVEESTQLHVLAAQPGEALVPQLAVQLDLGMVGGSCTQGTHRSARIASPGVLEVFSQPWTECGREGCIDPDDPDAPAPEDQPAMCQAEPVTAERATWDAAAGAWQWSAFEPLAHEAKVLPDGIMK